MPKQTFLNLPEEKRTAFIEIALKEFAENEYNVASVSQIVEKAGIAKGSLYQYFADKKDLFLFLVDVCNRTMMEFITQVSPPDPNADFLSMLRWQMSSTVRASVQYPIHSKLLRRAYSSPLPFRDDVFEQARNLRGQHFQAMVKQAQERGKLDPMLDPAVVSFVVQGVMLDMGNFLQNKFAGSEGDWVERPEVDQIFDQVIGILRNGLEK